MVIAERRKGQRTGNLPDIRMAKFSHALEFEALL